MIEESVNLMIDEQKTTQPEEQKEKLRDLWNNIIRSNSSIYSESQKRGKWETEEHIWKYNGKKNSQILWKTHLLIKEA